MIIFCISFIELKEALYIMAIIWFIIINMLYVIKLQSSTDLL